MRLSVDCGGACGPLHVHALDARRRLIEPDRILQSECGDGLNGRRARGFIGVFERHRRDRLEKRTLLRGAVTQNVTLRRRVR